MLAICAFGLAACPFAVWIGRYLVRKDIRDYGDRNPGTANVFRAAGVKWGILSLVLEIAKGFPFVFLAYWYFRLSGISVIIVILSAILGHAYSPILHFKGGKALAVTGGSLLALPPCQIFITVLAFMALFWLFIEQDAWTVIFSFFSTCVLLVIIKGITWEPILLFLVLIILTIKHINDLKAKPIFKFRFLHLLPLGK
jgi:glycerol-3-phosphate acyltransferase PlsY